MLAIKADRHMTAFQNCQMWMWRDVCKLFYFYVGNDKTLGCLHLNYNIEFIAILFLCWIKIKDSAESLKNIYATSIKRGVGFNAVAYIEVETYLQRLLSIGLDMIYGGTLFIKSVGLEDKFYNHAVLLLRLSYFVSGQGLESRGISMEYDGCLTEC